MEFLLKTDKQANHLIYGDEQHLYNVFSNLYDNAIKYSKDELYLSLFPQEATIILLRLYLCDNGIGMSSSVQRHIFDAFFENPRVTFTM